MTSIGTSGTDRPQTSDEDAPRARAAAPEGTTRSRRACDNCRKAKNKCIMADDPDKPCDACVSAKLQCTFLEPTFKTGPPKGYIKAIEQRLRQVESILGFIIGAPDARAATLIADLTADRTAREIIRRVDAGPFGPSGRTAFQASADVPMPHDAFLAAIARSADAHEKHENRAARGSRQSREAFSTDSEFLENPTFAWQDSLRLYLRPGAHGDTSQNAAEGAQPAMSGMQDGRPAQSDVQPVDDWEEYANADDADEEIGGLAESSGAIGGLSLDEDSQLRHHGEVSGMPLLENVSRRTDDLNEGRIWRLPMARSKPFAAMGLASILDVHEEDIEVEMPTAEHQLLLIDLYFLYVHPSMPVLHKSAFLAAYNEEQLPTPPAEHARQKFKISKLLLLVMFSIAARYNQHEQPMPHDQNMWEAGCDYLASARRILNSTFHRSDLTTCQALILLAYREIGIGSEEQSWIFLGMAIRMAQDLGLHREAKHWSRVGVSLFGSEEIQQRKWAWWACAIVDKHVSCSLGRPVSIVERDFDNRLPQGSYTDEREDQEMWAPHPLAMPHKAYSSLPASTTTCFIANCKLSIIVGRLVEKMYPIHPNSAEKRHKDFLELETDLRQWSADLPECLRYSPTGHIVPPPHILTLHLQFWWAVILLYRKFIPRRKAHSLIGSLVATSNAAISPEKALATCRAAATHISKIATSYREAFSMNAASAFVSAYLMSAGIIHIASLSLKRDDMQAGLGLQQIVKAFKDLSITWPSASSSYDLLVGVEVNFKLSALTIANAPGKRAPEEAFGSERQAESSRKAHATGSPTDTHPHRSASGPTPVHQLVNVRLLAHALNIEIPGVEPLRLPTHSESPKAAEYEWWPSTEQWRDTLPTSWDTMLDGKPASSGTEVSRNAASMDSSGSSSTSEWLPSDAATTSMAESRWQGEHASRERARQHPGMSSRFESRSLGEQRAGPHRSTEDEATRVNESFVRSQFSSYNFHNSTDPDAS